MSTAVPDPASVLAAYLREAVEESRLAYEFNATSYTFSAMSTCIAAERALDVLRGALEDSLCGREDADGPWCSDGRAGPASRKTTPRSGQCEDA
jgi:hypothetical protein